MEVKDKNGRRLWVGAHVERLLFNGECGGIIGVVTDVRRRRVDVTWILKGRPPASDSYEVVRDGWSLKRTAHDLVLKGT